MDSLTALTFLPLVGALIVLAMPAAKEKAIRLVALATTLVVAVLGIATYLAFDGASAALQGTVEAAWFTLPYIGGGEGVPVHFRLGMDGLSVLMVGLTAVMMPIVILSTYGHIHTRVKEFFVWMLVMETGMLGVFLSMDLVLFYVFWEVSLVPLYFLVGIWGGANRLYATVKFFLYTVAGSLVMLVAIIALVHMTGSTDIGRLMEMASNTDIVSLENQSWMFFAFALAFAIKVPVIPFHTWLADAHTEAPTSGSVLLAGVLLKMGTYGLLRFAIGFFPMMALQNRELFMALGAIGIVYGALLAMAQTDIKRLVACSSVSHLGFVVMGMFALTETGLRGSVLQMVNHGLSTGLLFLLIGMIYERRHTRAIADFGGVALSMPIFAFFFIVSMLSSVGLPGLNGFVGEFMILLGSFEASPLWGTIGVTGVIFGAIYLLSATRRLLFGPLTRKENEELQDLNLREVGLMVPLVLLCVWIGFKPNDFLSELDGSIDALVVRIEAAETQLQLDETALFLDDSTPEPAVALVEAAQ
ncbi:MAG: NADH-quinone oxidoreductase subunit M [Planctomycetota bacterium]|nr:NADH-quinone oxidoreductase subunit M [Planctomycetota bacterium]